MKDDDLDVGSRVRIFRSRNGISLNKLAEITGIAASNLSSIELNKTSPTLPTLIRIAAAFGMKVGQFLDEVLYEEAVLLPAGEHSGDGTIPPCSVAGQTQGIFGRQLDCFRIELAASAEQVAKDRDGVHRLLCCLEGRVRINVKTRHFELNPGDCLYVFANRSVTLQAVNGRRASVIEVRPAVRLWHSR
jgi:transcriptional regulator with XRE-family HTH domain